jgi:hypothetical protein
MAIDGKRLREKRETPEAVKEFKLDDFGRAR